MSKSILFVDDEPSILGIYEMLQPFLGPEFSIATATNAQDALQLMTTQPVDVVVSDLTMPQIGGIDFLTRVAAQHPATARIVISGYADEITAAKCVMVGHRYFNKPFSPNTLTTVLHSLCDAQTKAANNRIREYVGRLESIPTLSRTFQELNRALRSNGLPIRDISAIIERDLALTAKVLQMVNSARFSPARRINSIFEAVQMLGFDLVRALVLGIHVFQFGDKISSSNLYQTVWNHSLQTAFGAKQLAALEGLDSDACEDAFLLGLLHDIGKVVLAASCSEYHDLWKKHFHDSRTLIARENDAFGANHSNVGAYLLRLWGLSETVADGVDSHHNLAALKDAGFSPLFAVHAAQQLAADRHVPIDADLLDHLGLKSHVSDWAKAIRAEEARGKA
jgi:putative nucleotidyltransferase with HDIG domain